MPVKFILAIIGVLLVAVFAVQNYAPVELHFITLSGTISMALVIIISACVGAVCGLSLSMVKNFQNSRQIKLQTKSSAELTAKTAELERNLGNKESELIAAKQELQKNYSENQSMQQRLGLLQQELEQFKKAADGQMEAGNSAGNP